MKHLSISWFIQFYCFKQRLSIHCPFAIDFIYYWYSENLASARKQKQYAATKKKIALQIRSSIAPKKANTITITKKASFTFHCSIMHFPLNQAFHQVPHVNDHFWNVDPFSSNLFSKISRFPTPFSPLIPRCYHFLTTTSNSLTSTPQLRKLQRHNLVDSWFTSSLNTQHAWLRDSPSAGGRGDDVYFSGFFSPEGGAKLAKANAPKLKNLNHGIRDRQRESEEPGSTARKQEAIPSKRETFEAGDAVGQYVSETPPPNTPLTSPHKHA